MTMSRDLWKLLVVVPAHNEQELIGRCVSSVYRAIEQASGQLEESCLVVLADRCVDDTVGAVQREVNKRREARGNHRTIVIESDAGNVGSARAQATEWGIGLLRPALTSRAWIANTDADTMVPESWICDQLRWADRGYVGVAGTVSIDSFADYAVAIERSFHDSYTAPLPGDADDHPHVHAANMGIRMDAYLSTEGWASLTRSEDRDLWTQLSRGGFPTKSPSSLRVVTSGRRNNRIVNGFAAALELLESHELTQAMAEERASAAG